MSKVQSVLYVKVRYFVKSSGSVVSRVQSETREYTVTLNRNGQHTCSCEGNATFHRTCKHIKHCRSIENARAATVKAAKLASVERDLERICLQAEAEAVNEQAKPVATRPPVTPLAPLNGNRPFSIPR